ncbi:MAG: response regulator [Longimicrobiales bacterium]|nr:response regulator [Longimicrobiales bacterium]
MLATLLESADFEVSAVCDGRQALDLLEGEMPFDLVVTDLMMPEVDGLALVSAVRKMPGRVGVPIVMLTAKGQDADCEEAYRRGVSDFMTKPFSPKKLLARVRELLD